MSTKIKMNPKGIRAVLTHPAVVAMIDKRGQAIADAAGDGFAPIRRTKRVNRYGVTIRTVTDKGRERQADGNVLIPAIEAGR